MPCYAFLELYSVVKELCIVLVILRDYLSDTVNIFVGYYDIAGENSVNEHAGIRCPRKEKGLEKISCLFCGIINDVKRTYIREMWNVIVFRNRHNLDVRYDIRKEVTAGQFIFTPRKVRQ